MGRTYQSVQGKTKGTVSQYDPEYHKFDSSQDMAVVVGDHPEANSSLEKNASWWWCAIVRKMNNRTITMIVDLPKYFLSLGLIEGKDYKKVVEYKLVLSTKMVDWWWFLVGAAVLAVVVGQAFRMKKRRKGTTEVEERTRP
ncbi:hypothetical protein F0562_002871 [Nyssa sinensis]|uniref:Uncharacterized protein n=1 Tax=Nyssa sinensis TaxID=561372 RepID=A0A5J5BWC7_9ASTE|nr:hypothetical protein F0562_002871 [Nyssa sinensis]